MGDGDRSNVAVHYIAVAFSTLTTLSVSEFVSLGMLALGLATFSINVWYKKNYLKILRKEKGES